MKYLDDMLSKWGFGDGGEEPAEARALRRVYVRSINYFAQQTSSAYRLVAYDRPGMHNGCMVIVVRQEWLQTKAPAKVKNVERGDCAVNLLLDEDWPGVDVTNLHVGLDTAFGQAVDLAEAADVGEYVTVRVSTCVRQLDTAIRAQWAKAANAARILRRPYGPSV